MDRSGLSTDRLHGLTLGIALNRCIDFYDNAYENFLLLRLIALRIR